MQANNHQKPKAREKHIHEDPMGREQASMLFNMLMEGEKEGKKKWEGCTERKVKKKTPLWKQYKKTLWTTKLKAGINYYYL